MSSIKDVHVDLPRHAWDSPPLLLIVSPTPPVHYVDAYVRTYARSITWQPNEKRLTIFYEYGALSHARFVLRGSPSIRQYYMQTISKYNILLFSSSYGGSFISHFPQIFCLVSMQYSKFLWKGTQFRAIFQAAKRGDSIFDHFYVFISDLLVVLIPFNLPSMTSDDVWGLDGIRPLRRKLIFFTGGLEKWILIVAFVLRKKRDQFYQFKVPRIVFVPTFRRWSL